MFEQWKASHANGDLNDRKVLREALSYQNYLDSPAPIQIEASKVAMTVACDRLLDNGIYPKAEQCCLGAEANFAGAVVYFVTTKKNILPKPGPHAKLDPSFLQEALLKTDWKAFFISDWTDDGGNSVLPAPDQVNFGELAKELGLCGKNWKTDTPLIIIAFNVERAYKSTWLDSGLVFYWYPALHCAAWGLTRSLETGHPALREWVIPNRDGAFKVVDYWDRRAEEDYDFSSTHLGNDYWNTCVKELRP